MKRLIVNVDVLDLNSEEKVLKNQNILIDGNRIAKIAPDIEVVADEVLDAKGKLAMPGLINSHSHLGMSLFRNYADEYDLNTWLNDYIWPAEASLTPDDIYWGSLLSMVEMIQSGTTTFCDMYFSMDLVAKATEEAGLRGVLTTGITDIAGNRDEKFAQTVDFISRYADGHTDTVKAYLGPHSIYTCSKELLEMCLDYSMTENVPINIHLSETMKEVKDSIAANGMTPIEYVHSFGMTDAHIIAAHCTHITDGEIELVKGSDFYPIYNPSSNLKLASGFTPIVKMLNSNLTIGLGTDGSSSNNNQNMFEEMHLSSLVNKGRELDPKVVDAEQSLRFATINGAKAMKIDDLGELKEGNLADIVLVNLDAPHLYPRYNDIAALVYSAQASDVDTVIVNGKILMENREIPHLDIERIIYEVEKIGAKLKVL